MEITFSNRWQLELPETYKLIVHDAIEAHDHMNTFLENVPMDEDLANLFKKHDSTTQDASRYELKMGNHSLTFWAEISGKCLEDMSYLVANKRLIWGDNVYVEKVCINGNDGMYCRIETESFSNLEWWIKKDDSIVCLQLHGPGLLSEKVKADLISIVESLKSK